MKLRASTELTLVATCLAHVRAELEAPMELARLLDAEIPPDWPPGEYDRDALEYFRARFEEGGDAVVGWYGFYAIRDAVGADPRAVVGAGGYFGPPTPTREVEIGYSIVPRWQRRGYATRLVEALVANAFATERVDRVLAHTTAANAGSVAVLVRCGFRDVGAGAEPGTVRFERTNGS